MTGSSEGVRERAESGSSEGGSEVEFHDTMVKQHETFAARYNTYVCIPLATYIPAWVAPNAITLASGVCVFFLGLVPLLAVYVEDDSPLAAAFLRVLGGFLLLAYGTLDCLDGIHARATKQTSRVGECLDHWLDAGGVQIVTMVLGGIFPLDSITLPITYFGAFATYYMQLKIYHMRGQFIEPPADGVLAQVLGALIMVFIGVARFWLPREHALWGYNRWWIPIWGMVSCLRNLGFYYKHMQTRGMSLWNSCGEGITYFLVFSVMYWCHCDPANWWSGNIHYVVPPQGMDVWKWMSPVAFQLLCACVAIRLSGDLVLHVALKRDRTHWDISIGIWAAILWTVYLTQIYASQYFAWVPPIFYYALPYVACGHIFLEAYGYLQYTMGALVGIPKKA